MSTPAPSDATRIEELEARVAELTQQAETAEPRSSRRKMLKLAGAAAAGAAAVAVAGKASPVAANDGDPLLAGADVTTTPANRNDTGLIYTNSATPQVPGLLLGSTTNGNIFTVRDERPSGGPIIFLGSASASSYPAAVGGYTYQAVDNGVYGYTGTTGAGVVGYGGGAGSVGVLARGNRANANLYPTGDPGPARADAHVVGDLIADANGGLWYCTVAGTPGTFVSLTTGHFHALSPGRLYDSRVMTPAAPLAKDATRDLVLRDKVNAQTIALETANYVPAGATSLAVNVTVVNTVNAGFLAVNPLGDTVVHAATINWSASGQILNNGVIITLGGDRQVTVIAGGNAGAQTDFVIDVTGYFA